MKIISNLLISKNGNCRVISYLILLTFPFILSSHSTTRSICIPQSINTTYEWIEQVSFNSINNISGNDGGYGNFLSISTNVDQGQFYSLSVTPGFSGSSYNECFVAFIDWNGNQNFELSEQINLGSSNGTVVNNITIPSTPSPTVRMRISMRHSVCATACLDSFYGEVEDYILIINSPCTSN